MQNKKQPKKPKPKNPLQNHPRPVQIQPHQVKHYKRVLEILSHEYGYADVSPFGAGKTHIVFAIAAAFKLNIIGVGPKSTRSNWIKWSKIYGINMIGFLTYQSLRGQSDKLNHNLLRKVNGEYIATEFFERCTESGLLLVFDEYHNLKNDNTQLASAHALVKSLVQSVRMGYKARIALLSATPCEVKDYVTSTFKMLGIILSDNLYNYNRSSKKYELVGIQEAINKCNEYDPDETLAISCRTVNKTTAKTICYDLYTRVLKRFVVSSMPPPPIDAEKDSKNFYALMEPKNVERLKKGILKFKKATNYRYEVQEVNLSGVNWGDVTTSRMEIDSAKIPAVCRLSINHLESNPHCKILIYCNYKRDMATAANLLGRYNPLVMNGATSEKKRQEIIDAFQADNGDQRVFISNPKVGGIGIDLDDKIGNRPRIMFVLPSYFFTDQYQATGRIHRIGTMSKATIYFVYSRAFPYETGILNSMANKSQVVRNMVTKEQNNIKFPGEYDEIIELTPDEIRTGVTNNMAEMVPDIVEVVTVPNTDTPDTVPVGNALGVGTATTTTTTTTDTPTTIPVLGTATPDTVTITVLSDTYYLDIRERYETLRVIKSRNELDEDKFHTYGLFIEMVDAGTPEKDAVHQAAHLIYDNIRERFGPDIQIRGNIDQYNTVTDLINFTESFCK